MFWWPAYAIFFSLARTFESGSQEAEDGVVSLTISFTKPFAEFFHFPHYLVCIS